MTPSIEDLLAAKKWKSARALIQDELLASPADHWLWMHLGLTYYEQKNYEKALTCSKRAVELEPNCALTLWHYAGCLAMTKKESAALAIWTLILDLDPDEVAESECGEGIDWALQLINDVHFRMGRCFEHVGHPELARTSYEKYLHNRDHGVTSLYEVDLARKRLAALNRSSALKLGQLTP